MLVSVIPGKKGVFYIRGAYGFSLTFSVELFMDGAGLTSSTEHRARAKIADCVE